MRARDGERRQVGGDERMEMEMRVEMNETVERLAAAVGMLEAAVSRLAGIEVQAGTHELEERLAAAEARVAELSARAGAGSTGSRKTLQAKGGVAEGLEGGIDAALTSLSLEQRIAVKSQMMRMGFLG